MPEVLTIVPAATLFPGIDRSFDSFAALIRRLSRTDVLFWCARLNLMVSNPKIEPVDAQHWAASSFLGDVERRRLDAYARQYGGPRMIRLFWRGQLLELLRWTCLLGDDRADDGDTFKNPRVRRWFAQAALMAGDIWEKRAYRDGLPQGDDLSRARVEAIATFRHARAAGHPAIELERALGRAAQIHRTAWSGLENVDDDFRDATRLSLEEYAAFMCAMSHFCRVSPKRARAEHVLFDRSNPITTLTDAAANALPHFMALESQSIDELRARLLKADGRVPDAMDGFDEKVLLERPVLASNSGRCVVIDSVILSDKIWVGAVFHLARRRPADAFTSFGDGFEAYIGGILSGIWKQTILNPKRRQTGGEIELADAAIVVEDVLFVIETKSVFLAEDATPDAEAYVDRMRQRYVQQDRPGKKSQPKGVQQLARAIRRLVDDDFLAVPGDLGAVTLICPLLIVRDAALSVPGHLELLGPEFAHALASDPSRASSSVTQGRFTVAPLTIASVDELEDLHASREALDVRRLIVDYTRAEYEGPRASFHDFMVYGRYRHRFRRNRELARLGAAQMRAAGRYLFSVPEPSWSEDEP